MTSAIGKFDEITESFAAAATDPSLWNKAMEVAAQATGSLGANLVPLRGRQPDFPMTDTLRAAAEAYLGEGWINRDERYRGVPTMYRRGVATDFDYNSPTGIERHPFYQEFLARFGLRWSACVKVGSGDDVWSLTLQRSIVQGPFALAEVKELALLSKCLAGASELARAFGFARAEAALEAFEISGSAVAMLDRCGEVFRLNSAAEHLLGEDLQIAHRRLVSFDGNATAALDRALHALIWSADGLAMRPLIVLPRKRGRPILAHLSRSPGTVKEGFGLCQALVVLVDLEARPTTVQSDLI